MIEITQLTDEDVGRRVIWEIGPGIENPGQLATWTEDKLLLAMKQADSMFLRIVEDVDPAQVRWADRLSHTGEVA